MMSTETALHPKTVKEVITLCGKAKQYKGKVMLWSSSVFLLIADTILIQNLKISVHDGELAKLDPTQTYSAKKLYFTDCDQEDLDLFQQTRKISAVPQQEPVECYRDGLSLFYPWLDDAKTVKKVITRFNKKNLLESWVINDGLLCIRDITTTLITLIPQKD